MSKTVVALDCMGGDYAPVETVKAAVEALRENNEVYIKLFGKEDDIKLELDKYENIDKLQDRFEVIDAPETIEMDDSPVMAIRTKTESSIVKCLYAVKHGEADAMVSAGSTGANLVGGHVVIGRLKGVERPPLAPFLPTKEGPVLLIDCGANVDARPSHLVQFAKMGSIYVQNALGIDSPRVGLVNIGAEEEKGNALTKETFELLKEVDDINFVGNVEARDIPDGAVDVAVCDAFVGNVILKTYEGVGAVLLSKIKEALMSTLKTKIGALLIKGQLKKTMKKFDIEQYGGAPMLGLKGLLVKTHGNSKSVEIKNSILQCAMFKEYDISNKIKDSIADTQEEK